MADSSKKVQDLINDNAVVVFSKSYCPYCAKTKQALNQLKAEYKVLELDNLSDGAALQDALEVISGQRSVPNIYINKEHIGGNSDLQERVQKGTLAPLLKEVGALA